MRLGKYQKELLAFAQKHPGPHYYHQDARTQRTVKSMVHRGLILDDGERFQLKGDLCISQASRQG